MIHYLAGDDIERLESSPHLERLPRAAASRCCSCPIRSTSFWVMSAGSFDGKPLKSVTQGAADLATIPLVDARDEPAPELQDAVKQFLVFMKTTLGDTVAEVCRPERLTDSAVCLVASDVGPDRALERMLAGAGGWAPRLEAVLEVNPRHQLVVAIAGLGGEQISLKEDAVHLLLDEARVLEGSRPADPRSTFPSGSPACWKRASGRADNGVIFLPLIPAKAGISSE